MTELRWDADMRREMMRRMNDGWVLQGTRTRDGMTMTHMVSPPGWRIAIDFLNPISWALGPSWPVVSRTLVVSVGGDGKLYRRTTGEIPRGWPKQPRWEVHDAAVSD